MAAPPIMKDAQRRVRTLCSLTLSYGKAACLEGLFRKMRATPADRGHAVARPRPEKASRGHPGASQLSVQQPPWVPSPCITGRPGYPAPPPTSDPWRVGGNYADGCCTR